MFRVWSAELLFITQLKPPAAHLLNLCGAGNQSFSSLHKSHFTTSICSLQKAAALWECIRWKLILQSWWWMRLHPKLPWLLLKEETFSIKGGGLKDRKQLQKFSSPVYIEILTQFDVVQCQSWPEGLWKLPELCGSLIVASKRDKVCTNMLFNSATAKHKEFPSKLHNYICAIMFVSQIKCAETDTMCHIYPFHGYTAIVADMICTDALKSCMAQETYNCMKILHGLREAIL